MTRIVHGMRGRAAPPPTRGALAPDARRFNESASVEGRKEQHRTVLGLFVNNCWPLERVQDWWSRQLGSDLDLQQRAFDEADIAMKAAGWQPPAALDFA